MGGRIKAKRTQVADIVAVEDERRDEDVRRERRVALDESCHLLRRGLVVELILREVDERRVRSLRARKLYDGADALARDLIA